MDSTTAVPPALLRIAFSPVTRDVAPMKVTIPTQASKVPVGVRVTWPVLMSPAESTRPRVRPLVFEPA